MALPNLPRPGHKMSPKAYCLEVHRIKHGSQAKKPDLKHLLRQILARDIDEWRRKSFSNFVIEIDISQFEGSKPYIDEDGDRIGWYTYNFQLIGIESSKLIFEKPLSVRYGRGEVQIRFNKKFQKIEAYLEQLKASLSGHKRRKLNPDQQLAAWAQQAQWWNANGKAFPLMVLPQEIREIIFGFALEGSAEPYAMARCRKSGWASRAIANRQPKTSVFRTSRAVYEEASHVFFLYNAFLIEHYGVFRKVMQNQDLVARVRKLKLALDHTDFLRLFGVDDEEGLLVRVDSHADALRLLELNHFELCFAPPSSISGRTWLDNACHTEVVDLILDAAWPYIKGHPVLLTGYIKTQQAAAFAARNAEEKSKVEAWNRQRALYGLKPETLHKFDKDPMIADKDDELGGVRLDGEPGEEAGSPKHEGNFCEYYHEASSRRAEKESEEIFFLPSVCECEPACTLDEWTP